MHMISTMIQSIMCDRNLGRQWYNNDITELHMWLDNNHIIFHIHNCKERGVVLKTKPYKSCRGKHYSIVLKWRFLPSIYDEA